MLLETAAGIVADRIKRQEFIEVYTHHDADGIAAASILCHAMLRAGIRFRLRVRQEIALSDLGGDKTYLLCDLGAALELETDHVGVEADRSLDVAHIDAVLPDRRRHVATLCERCDEFQIRLVRDARCC